jgi:hypothetical protein
MPHLTISLQAQRGLARSVDIGRIRQHEARTADMQSNDGLMAKVPKFVRIRYGGRGKSLCLCCGTELITMQISCRSDPGQSYRSGLVRGRWPHQAHLSVYRWLETSTRASSEIGGHNRHRCHAFHQGNIISTIARAGWPVRRATGT